MRSALRKAGARDGAPTAPWIALAAAGGPTSASGPLRHDIIVPVRTGPPRAGLNVFNHDGRLPIAEEASSWSARFLGEEAAHAVEELRRTASQDVAWNGGAWWAPEGCRLKLYFTARSAGIEPMWALASALGLGRPARAPMALGLDVSERGIERARVYSNLDPLEEGLAFGPSKAPQGRSHCLLSELGRWGEPGSKRTRSHIFSPRASLEGLREAEGRVFEAAGPAGGRLDLDWLDQAAVLARESGLELRPAAHEMDVFWPGAIATDGFVTLSVN